MSKFSGCLKFLAIVVIGTVTVVMATGVWLNNNRDQVVDAAITASGVKEAVASERSARCARAKKNAQAAWDLAVESGQASQRTREIDAMDAEVRELCGG